MRPIARTPASSHRLLITLAVVVASSQLLLHKVSAQSCAASGAYCGNDQTGPGCCSNGEYCQPWNPNYYQCRPKPAKGGVVEVGIDYHGSDIVSFEGLKQPDDCCNKCAETSGCAAYTFMNYGWDGQTHCYLKSSTGVRKNVVGAVSSVLATTGTITCSKKNGDYCGNSKGATCCPSDTYCQPWNQDFYQCKDVPAACPTQLTDTDFYGNDIGSPTFGKYPWDCCTKCTQTSGCVGYTFVNSDSRGPACYLKSSLSGKRSTIGAVSGIVKSVHVQALIRNGALQAKSVNLGGWLVSENWMSWESPLYNDVPSNLAWQGEYTVMKTLVSLKGRDAAIAAFEKHRQMWITEADIKEIARTNVLNTVRVPVGHWIIRDATTAPGSEGDMYAPGGLKYIDTLINDWAVKYNIAVMLSLHAHQGSQNGFESTSPPVNGETKWSTSQTNYENSIKFATFLAARYKDSPAFLGISLMNEPASPIDRSKVLSYYAEAYKQIRATGNKCVLLVSPLLSEQGPEGFTGMISGPQYENLWNEIHTYFIWGYADKSEQWVLDNLDTYSTYNLQKESKDNRLLIGEWCMGGPPDQNGIFQNMDNFRELGQKQLAMFNQYGSGGWAFWSWRHSDESIKRTGWSMRKLIRDGDLKLV